MQWPHGYDEAYTTMVVLRPPPALRVWEDGMPVCADTYIHFMAATHSVVVVGGDVNGRTADAMAALAARFHFDRVVYMSVHVRVFSTLHTRSAVAMPTYIIMSSIPDRPPGTLVPQPHAQPIGSYLVRLALHNCKTLEWITEAACQQLPQLRLLRLEDLPALRTVPMGVGRYMRLLNTLDVRRCQLAERRMPPTLARLRLVSYVRWAGRKHWTHIRTEGGGFVPSNQWSEGLPELLDMRAVLADAADGDGRPAQDAAYALYALWRRRRRRRRSIPRPLVREVATLVLESANDGHRWRN